MKSYTREYNIWAMMRQRCSNPKAANYIGYGARGIKVCLQWAKFDVFLADMGPAPTPQHTLDRENNEGDYTPANCRWASSEVQQNNRRDTVSITAFGKTQSLAQWVRETGLSRTQIKHRIFVMGLQPEAALKAERMSWNQRPVIQRALSGDFIEKHASLAEASKNTGMPAGGIWNALAKKSKTAYGFLWEYEVLS